MKKIAVIGHRESILYLTKLARDRASNEVHALLDPSAFPSWISGVRARGAGDHGTKAWGVERRIACLQSARGHQRSGVE